VRNSPTNRPVEVSLNGHTHAQVAPHTYLIFQIPSVAHRHEQKVVREKLKAADINVALEHMHLGPRVVVYADCAPLGRSKHRLVVQPCYIAHCLFGMELGADAPGLPVKRGQVPLAPTEEQMSTCTMRDSIIRTEEGPAVACVRDGVRAKVLEFKVEDLPSHHNHARSSPSTTIPCGTWQHRPMMLSVPE
jgi:hypothetical protein